MENPIDEANILSLPDELDIYQEQIDPTTGKVIFQIDKQTVTIVAPKILQRTYLR